MQSLPSSTDLRAALIDAAAAVSLGLPITNLLNATEVAGDEEPWRTVLPGRRPRAVCSRLEGDLDGVIALALGEELCEAVEGQSPEGGFAEQLHTILDESSESVGGILGIALRSEMLGEFDPRPAFATTPDHAVFASIELLDDGAHVATLAVLLSSPGGEVPLPEILPPPDAATAEAAESPGEGATVPDDREADGSEILADVAEADFDTPDVETADFQLLPAFGSPQGGTRQPIDLLADVELGVSAELGRTRMSVRRLLSLAPGAVVELDRSAGSPIDVLVNGKLIARGEVIVIDEEFGVRISEVVGYDPPRAHHSAAS